MLEIDQSQVDDQDSKYNPAENLHQQEQRGPDFTWDNPKDVKADDVKSAESKSIPYESSSEQAKPGPPRKHQRGNIGRFLWKRKGPTGIIVGFVLGGGMLVGTISPSLAGISFIQNVTDDLGDRMSALTISNNSILRNKLIKSAKSGSLRGCTKVSISCKLKTFSKSELARLEKAGIKVNSDGKSWSGRIKATSIEFRGSGPMTPDQWSNELKTNQSARNAQLKANNMKYRGLSSNGPFGKVMTRFGVSKQAPGLSGDKKSRLNQLLTATGAVDTSKMKLVDVVDENGSPTGKKAVVTDGSSSVPVSATEGGKIPIYEGDKQIKRIEATIASGSSSKPPSLSATKKASVGAASILGVADLVCSTRNMIIGASVAAKVANEMRLIQYAIPLAATVGKIMAGDASPEDAEALGTFLTETDTRKTVESINPTGEGLELSGDSIDTSSGDTILVDNPNYGKSAMDANLLKMSTNGGVAMTTETTSQFSVGIGASSLFSSIANSVVGFAKGGPMEAMSDSTCNIVQNPFVRAGGIILSIAVGIGSAGSISVTQVAVMAGMIAGMAILEYTIQSALSGSQLTGLAEDTVGRGEALWSGLASSESATARATGMIPASVELLTEYNAVSNDVKDQYALMEKEDALSNPLDISNKFSLLGSFSRSIAEATNYSKNPLSYIPGSIVASIKTLSPLKSADALSEFNPDRFKLCDDEEYLKLGINADVQCNVRHAISSEVIALLEDPDKVSDYMEDNGHVLEDSETGMPERGYEPPNLGQSQQNIGQMALGMASEMTIGQFFSDKQFPTDYARWIETCPYRTSPYGKTGEETQTIGGLGSDWDDGTNCIKNTEELNYFRAYWILRSTVEVNDEEEKFESETTTTDNSDAPLQPTTDGDIAWPLNKELYSKRKDTFLKGHGTSSGTFVKPGGRTGKAADLGANGLGVNEGEPIYSVLDGKVVRIGGGHAIVVRSTVPGGTVDIAYAHGHTKVKAGDTVSAGQQISGIGNLGNSRGAHLHIDMNYNQQQFCPQDLFIFMNDNPGKLPDFASLVSKASKGSCSRL